MKAGDGRLCVIGLGPGAAEWVTPEATQALTEASDLVGYAPYLQRVPQRADQIRHASDNREELMRARQALSLTASGRKVAVVSGGDPGVFAMAAAVFEALETGDPSWRDLDVRVIPGITAMQAAAARIGAPLGHDFCAISLSDNLKSWDVVEKRLQAAADGDFVLALYNPASKARPGRIHDAFACLRARKPPATPVIFARALGRHEEKITVTSLAEADPSIADMATLVIIGSSATRLISGRGTARPFVYTPRAEGARP
ncbi:MAG: precorrin-3B C(17)-methyltransferase [Hyphomicrobiales bacterium]|nr:precorrin-3B C(17)-methyltransferase [Hyphomicrobiales bacterium]